MSIDESQVAAVVASVVDPELRRPLGITIIGGLVVSQVLTLFTTPVVYLFFDRIGRKYFHTQEADEERRRHELEPSVVAGD